MDGVIAPFWCDLDPSASSDHAGEGIYYQLVTDPDPRLLSFNKLIVEFAVPIFGHPNDPRVHFEVVMSADGSVLMQVRCGTPRCSHPRPLRAPAVE